MARWFGRPIHPNAKDISFHIGAKGQMKNRAISRRLTRVWFPALAVLAIGAFLGLSPAAGRAAEYESVEIKDVPHVVQKPDFCGEACAAMYLRKLGRDLDQDFVFDQSGLDPKLGRGCYTKELHQALRNIGFRTGAGGYTVNSKRAEREMEAQFAALHGDLLAGVPSIICMHYDDQPNTTEHFRLILGYDAKTDEVLYHEPALAEGGYQRMKREQLIKLWPLKYKPTRWTVIRLRLEPGRLIEGESSETFTGADYATHLHELKKRLPSKDFHIVLQPPFVVVGDQSAAMVRKHARRTVKWTVDHIKQQYFAKDPHEIIDIWLFKNKESYEKHNWQLFRHRPTTPYGYYSSTNKVLVMNIATGGGTLVHEIVHPFMEANFEDCPSWFNEGLASLYEQSSEKQGRIWGLTNWRLRGLQQAIAAARVPSFRTLCGTSTEEFYGEDPGTNYSQARYLCYYLQEQGLLEKYFHQFRRDAKDDPTGYVTLKEILGERDMVAFQKRWEKYVTKLRF